MEFFRKSVFDTNINYYLSSFFGNIISSNPVILCIGSDKLIADCMAPIVAEILRKNDIPYYIYGGVQNCINAQNLEYAFNFIKSKHNNSDIILIDSMAGIRQANIGDIVVTNKYKSTFNNLAIKPSICIYGITCLYKNNKITLGNLGLTLKLANTISQSILNSIKNKKKRVVV